MPEILAYPLGAPPILRPVTPTTRSVNLTEIWDRVRFDLSPLSRCTTLRVLQIKGSFETDGGLDLSPLRACTALEVLHIDSDRLEGLDLSPLDQHPALRKVTIRARQPVDLAPVAGWTGLHDLGLICPGWTACDLSPLTALRSLKALGVWQGEFTALSLEPLREVTPLEKVSLSCPNLRQLDLAPLAGLSRLREVRVENTRWLRTLDLAPLAGLGRLKLLGLSFNSRLEASLDPLAALRVGVVSTHRTRKISLCRELETSPLGQAVRHHIAHGEIVLV